MKTKKILQNRLNSDKELKDTGITQPDFPIAYSCDYLNEIQSALLTKATVNLQTPAHYINQNVSCHFFVLNDAHSKNRCHVALINYFLKLQQFIEIIYSDGSRSNFKNKYMMDVLHHFSKKHQVPFPWNYCFWPR